MQIIKNKISNIIFITGGTKSGKSEYAEYLARKNKKMIYIALSEARQNDKNWEKKILFHQKRRPEDWKLVETQDLISVLNREKGPMLIDSIGGFIMESINLKEEEWHEKVYLLLELLISRTNLTLIVGEQVGWSLVSEYEIGNKYIERLGELQKKITKISYENWLTINGRAIKLDNISFEIPTQKLEISLFEPRIPQNTGSIARTCAAFNFELNLIEPLGFKLEDKYLKRAGLDYWPLVKINKYQNFQKFKESKNNKRIISFSKKNGIYLKNFLFHYNDILLFGSEDNGLPEEVINQSDSLISIFMPNVELENSTQKGVRSLNLSVACGIAIYEAYKQISIKNRG